MKADIRIGKGRITGVTSLWIDERFDSENAALVAAQLTAIILGYADPVELK